MKIILVQSFERNRRWSYSELVLLWPSGQEFILCNLYYISNKKKKVSSHQKKSITWIIKYKYVLFKSKLWESPFRYRFFQCFLLEFSLVFHYPHFWSILHLINASYRGFNCFPPHMDKPRQAKDCVIFSSIGGIPTFSL